MPRSAAIPIPPLPGNGTTISRQPSALCRGIRGDILTLLLYSTCTMTEHHDRTAVANKPFRFLDLSHELRDHIYEFLILSGYPDQITSNFTYNKLYGHNCLLRV
jgi:hypothetical protein